MVYVMLFVTHGCVQRGKLLYEVHDYIYFKFLQFDQGKHNYKSSKTYFLSAVCLQFVFK